MPERLARPPKKILIIKPSSLGDVVHSLPFLNSIRSCFPKAEIHWVIAKGLEGLLDGHPMVDRLVVINKDLWKKISRATETAREVKRLFHSIRYEGYDLAIDLQGLLRSGLIAMASRAPVRVGFSEAREGSRLFYNRIVRGGRDIHAVERYMKVAGALGCDTEEIIFTFPFPKQENSGTDDFRERFRDYIVIVPGARWSTKIWPAENFGKTASMLPLRSVVIGSRADAAIAERVVGTSGGKAVSVAGKTSITELIEIMRGARLVISNDSGPMHIAAACGVPVAAIFGPTSPEMTGPYGRSHVVIRSSVSCSPCFKKKCSDLKCMKEITPAVVYERVRELLEDEG